MYNTNKITFEKLYQQAMSDYEASLTEFNANPPRDSGDESKMYQRAREIRLHASQDALDAVIDAFVALEVQRALAYQHQTEQLPTEMQAAAA